MKKFYTTLLVLCCFVTLQAQTFEFSIMYLGVNANTNNYQFALMATPSATVTNGVTADMGAGFYVPSGLFIANFIQGDSGLPNSEWVALPLGYNGNGDAYFIARIESGASSIILNGAGPFQLVLFDLIANPNPTSGQIIFVENGDPVFDSLFVQNYININLGSGTIDAYSQNNPSANSVSFSTLSTETVELAQVRIYPNPTSTILNISSSIDIEQITFFDILGQQVLKQNQNTSSNTIDVSTLSKGIYFLNITSKNDKTQTIKFIKN